LAIGIPAPFSNPAWHPNGKIVAFNHLPLVDSVTYGTPPCIEYDFNYSDDSAGFWLCGSDATGLRRVYGHHLNNPVWSPDGHWLLFDTGAYVFKMPFDGQNLDTSAIVALAGGPGNGSFDACWSNSGDTIYYNAANPFTNRYGVWKMAADGSGQMPVGDTTDKLNRLNPWCMPDGDILYVQLAVRSGVEQIFSMDAMGGNVRQITTDADVYSSKLYPRYYNNKIFYQAQGVNSVNTDGSGRHVLCHISSEGYSISKNGEIIYTNFGGQYAGYNQGNLWTMNADGSNNQAFLYNK
jgi:Tol biopolymer transport system component